MLRKDYFGAKETTEICTEYKGTNSIYAEEAVL